MLDCWYIDTKCQTRSTDSEIMLHTNYSHIDSTILLSTLNIVSLGEQVPSLTKHMVKLQYERKRSWNQYDSLLSLIVAENHILVLACLREWNTSSFSTQSRFIFALPHHATMWKLCLFNQGQKFNTGLLAYWIIQGRFAGILQTHSSLISCYS